MSVLYYLSNKLTSLIKNEHKGLEYGNSAQPGQNIMNGRIISVQIILNVSYNKGLFTILDYRAYQTKTRYPTLT